MENIIEYYYNLKLQIKSQKDNNYILKNNKNIYILKEIFNIDNINEINSLSKALNINIIIPNKNNNLYINIEDKLYTLILIKKISLLNLPNISNLSNINISPIPTLERNNWELLWSKKIDFLEEFLYHNNKKYPLITESSNYFIGLAENAVSYLTNTKKEVPKDNYLDRKVISHIKLSNSLYDPFNIIFDHKSRDIAEYIKYSFLNSNINIYTELDKYFKYNHYSKYGIQVLYSRILYPSFYFNVVDKIITENIDENYLNKIINKIDNYQNYLFNIHLYLSKYYDIPIPKWISNPHSQP